MITEVRVYDRALEPEEVARHYRTTRLTGEIALRPYVYPANGTVVVEADLRGVGGIAPRGAAGGRLAEAGRRRACHDRHGHRSAFPRRLPRR